MCPPSVIYLLSWPIQFANPVQIEMRQSLVRLGLAGKEEDLYLYLLVTMSLHRLAECLSGHQGYDSILVAVGLPKSVADFLFRS
mmetsp:Transcript_12700/g.19316  ORF Transcript_12700/g.19316 Transcript_12700/m.19316 type:complete len:84 (+) Transcript_12700:447-698(+)